MTPDEVQAVGRISPQWAPYIVLAVPLIGGLAFTMQWLPRLPALRSLVLRLTGWDPGAVPEDETSRRTMQLIDQLQEEVTRCRHMLERYDAELEHLRLAKVGLLSRLGDVRDAAIAARLLVHELERRFGLPETTFEPLPGTAKEEQTMLA